MELLAVYVLRDDIALARYEHRMPLSELYSLENEGDVERWVLNKQPTNEFLCQTLCAREGLTELYSEVEAIERGASFYLVLDGRKTLEDDSIPRFIQKCVRSL
jgi:hypothetical protein